MNEHISSIFELQAKHKQQLRHSTAEMRIASLRRLKSAISHFEEDIYKALADDLRKSRFESAISEVFFIQSELDFAIKKLKGWMRPKSAARTLTSLLARSSIHYEPRGVCLVIASWNYPFQVSMSPLISVIAAGNCVILKPSEFSPAVAQVLQRMMEHAFQPEEVCCINGDQDVSAELLKLPFDHIFFTGSPQVGKIVMKAAAENLTSVTLELGGKSPVIIDETVDLKKVAEQMAWGKLLNAGQTCIAPDYLLIQHSLREEFIKHYKAAVAKMFFHESGEINPASYARIVNQRHYDRVRGLIEDAQERGAKIVFGGATTEEPADSARLTILPTVITDLPEESKIMQEEIFGPVLPIMTYEDIDEAIAFILRKSKPLAFYLFSKDKKRVRHLLKSIPSGGACVNDVIIHVSNPNLPFGGVNGSGMGSCHGIFGFKAFSHERSVVYQSRFQPVDLVYPPYEEKNGIMKMLKRFM